MAGTSEATYGQHYADWKDWGAAGFGEADASMRAYYNDELRRAGLLPLAGKRVLEIGFGNGAFLAHARSAGANVSGTEAIDVLVDRARAAGIDAHAALDLNAFADASFDAVAMFDVLEHIPQDDLVGVLADVRRKLKPGGTLIARFPNGDSPLSLAIQNGDPTHITYLGSEKIRYLLRQAGLEPRFVGAPAPVLNDPDLKRRVLKWGQLLPRKAIERTVKLLFFPHHDIHFFSSNLVVNAVAPPGRQRADRSVSMFLLMLAMVVGLTAWSIARLLQSRFLKPVDLAVVSTFYYTVPLAVAGYFIYNPRNMIFLHPQAADPAIAIQSMRYALAAIVSLYLGHWAASFLGAPRLATYFKLDQGGLPRAWLAMAGLIAIIGLGVLQFGIPEFMSGYATESGFETGTLGLALVYFSVGSMGLVVVYALLLQRFLSRRELWLLVLAAIVVALVVLVIRSKRLEIVTTFLPVAILLLAARGTLKVATYRVVLGVAAVSALIAVAMIRIGDQFELFTVNFYLLSEGLYAGHALPGIIHRLDTGMLGYENGARFINSLLAFLPRFVWEGKDEAVYAGNLALEGVAPLGATSFLAEVVLQGGLKAVVLVHLVLGFIFERSTRFGQVWDAALASGRIPGRFIAYLALTAIFIPHFRDGIIPAVKLTLQAFVFLVLLAGLHQTPAWLLQRGRAAGPPGAPAAPQG